MKRGQIVIAVLAVGAVAIALALAGGKSDDNSSSSTGTTTTTAQKAPGGAIAVPFRYSPEKQPLLEPLIKEFNSGKHEVNGKPVFIEAAPGSSGEDETKLARGTEQLVAWSP